MRITNQMMTNTILLNINRNRETLMKYQEQRSTGKKIQRASDDPIIAVRALRYRANLSEIEQYKTNATDAKSWANVSEQAVINVSTVVKRIRDLSVQATTGSQNLSNKKSTLKEVDELMQQFLNETNASYAGRYVFSGHKTDVPGVFTKPSTDTYQLTESFTKDSVSTSKQVIGDTITDIKRIRLGYDKISSVDIAALNTSLGAGLTPTAVTSTAAGAYTPAVGTVNVLTDTGELVFNDADVASIPNFNVTYNKNGFDKTDLVPDHYFNGTNLTTGSTFTSAKKEISYQISYSQDLTVNTAASEVVSTKLQRDIEELVNYGNNIKDDGSTKSKLQEDVLGKMFNEMLGALDGHIDDLLNTQTTIGGKVKRLDLTITRLDADKLNFTDLMSQNEDVDVAETLIKMTSMETIYQSSLSAAGKILQPSLLDFIN